MMKTKIPNPRIQEPKLEEMLSEALKHHQAGNFEVAATLYNEVLEIQPNNIKAISLFGTLNLQTGNHDTACMLLKKSLSLKPDNAMAYNNLGSALQASGRFEESIKFYKRAIELKPDYDEAYYNLGNTLQACNLLEEAIVIYKHAITLKPNDADIHNNLANALRKSGKSDEALKSYKLAAVIKPDNSEILCNLGAAFQELDNLGEAIANYQEAIILKPDNAKAHSNLGTALKKQNRLEDAEKSHNLAIKLKPDYAEAHNNLGTTLQSLGRLEEAIQSYKKAIMLKPHYAEAYYNFGNVLKEQSKLHEAFLSYKRAVTIKPDYVEAHNNLGITLQEQSQFTEAAESYSRAIELKPDYADAHFNRSLMLLLKRNFKDGWQEYEWRLRTKDYALRDFKQPMWDGSPLNGKTILVHTEQGLGDNIQFVRYLPLIQAQGGHVIFECLPSLVHLLKDCEGINKIIERTSTCVNTVEFDVQVPLLSLPRIFNTKLDNIPSKRPYIMPDSTFITKWGNRLGANDKSFKVGLVWASNPENKKIVLKKSFKLNDFKALSEIPGLSLYSLQKGPASAEAHNPPKEMKIINLDQELNDFADTAAAIVNLDLVITIDTSVAHLAGAIGKPVWTLLPFAPDWRWMLEQNDSPWYPSMRLFRQTKLNDWTEVFEKVKKALIKELNNEYRT
ncbi:MAG: tetratricopeptide repeat protein [Gammaproteobacteria bacterium]|nr:tetratricopeptide repeat protein [Gammaproteobacteria bacterium]